jgi:hypothetical protein
MTFEIIFFLNRRLQQFIKLFEEQTKTAVADLFDNIEALLIVHPTKDDMLPVQPGRLHRCDEELRSVGVLQQEALYIEPRDAAVLVNPSL